MAAISSSPVRECDAGQKRELIDDMLADSQDFAKEEDGGHVFRSFS